MNLQEYIAKAKFSEGLPQGDTIVELEKIDLENVQVTFDGKEQTRAKLKNAEGKEYFIPFSLIRDFKKQLEAGAKKVRVTRMGTTKNDTRYTIMKIE